MPRNSEGPPEGGTPSGGIAGRRRKTLAANCTNDRRLNESAKQQREDKDPEEYWGDADEGDVASGCGDGPVGEALVPPPRDDQEDRSGGDQNPAKDGYCI